MSRISHKKKIKIIDFSKLNNIDFSFVRENDLIYRRKLSYNMLFTFRRFYISTLVIKDILNLIHDENHAKFDKTYHEIVSS